MLSRLDWETAYESVFQTLWYSTLPCFDVQGSILQNSFTAKNVFDTITPPIFGGISTQKHHI
jgi:hypothetical protein